jgi:hypothetical protein
MAGSGAPPRRNFSGRAVSMQFLKRLRPSNLIIAAALPFIIYLFATSADYQRSLRAILGVENGSSVFVPGFVALALAFARRPWRGSVFAVGRGETGWPRPARPSIWQPPSRSP